jgi:peptide deformylase
MAILKVAVLGNPILRVPGEPVKNVQAPEIQRLIDDMIETMREYRGIGLAAPQVHRSLQLAVIEEGDHLPEELGRSGPLVLINPRIVPTSGRTEEDWEGCLSIPDLRGKVPRHAQVEVEALDRRSRPLRFAAKHFLARVVQHECDHLNARVFLDRMESFETLAFLEEYARYWAKDGDEAAE